MPTIGTRDLLRAVVTADATTASDADLLARFAATRDGAAFAAIVRRHGGVVLDVCRAVLRNDADAEDAFQAAFLVLARKAAAVRNTSALAAWLHGVALRTARKARVARARRLRREAVAVAPQACHPDDLGWADVRRLVHEALGALPERYRRPLVLYYLQGITQDQAAAALGLSRAAVKKRLERGRDLLRAALVRRGLGPSAGLAALLLSTVAVPKALAEAATRIAVGGHVPAPILSLVGGGMTMSMSRLTGAFGLVLVAGIALAVGSGHPAGRAEETPTPAAAAAADKDAPAAKEKKWLAGEWKLKHAETNGEALLTADDLDGAKIVFKDDTAEVKGFSVGFVRDFTFKLDPTKEPKEIDVTFTAGPRKGKTFEGIYLVRKNEMRICLRLEHPELGRPKGYVTNSGKTLYTFILEPAEKKDPPPKQDRPPAKPPVESPVATDLAAWEAIPVPDKTPFDGNAAERENYLRSYRDGFFWAKGNHLWCPTNPGAANLTAVRGWVEGWQAGVKAGGTSDLPAKYAPYLGWREPPGR